MPTYEYECRECNYQFESFQWMSDRTAPEKEVCPAVAWQIKRVLTPWLGAFPIYGI